MIEKYIKAEKYIKGNILCKEIYKGIFKLDKKKKHPEAK